MADSIAAKFCMTIKKIKPHDIFQNCVHSTSTLNIPECDVIPQPTNRPKILHVDADIDAHTDARGVAITLQLC